MRTAKELIWTRNGKRMTKNDGTVTECLSINAAKRMSRQVSKAAGVIVVGAVK